MLRKSCSLALTNRLCLTAVWIAVVAAQSFADGGFFFALDRMDQDDRVYRIDVDDDFNLSAVTPIGAPGALGFPMVRGIVWDWEHERLYGYDTLLQVWLEINVTTGAATELGPFTYVPFDMTYNPNNDMIYAVVGTGNLLEIDPASGESTIVAEGVASEALSHVLDTTGGLDGFFTGTGGLRLIVESSYETLDFGGSGGGRQEFEWDPHADVLFGFDTGSTTWIWKINQVSGEGERMAQWDMVDTEMLMILAITYVPAESTQQPACIYADDDDDGDIDLLDFGAFQACFTGSRK